VTSGADQPHPGSMCALTRVQRLFRGWHVVDGDVDRLLRKGAPLGRDQAGQAYRLIASFTQRATGRGTSHSIAGLAFVPHVGSAAVTGCSVGRGSVRCLAR
jgi:hypothetical protein